MPLILLALLFINFSPCFAQVKVLGNPNSIVYDMAFSEGGSQLAATENKRINLFELSSAKAVKTFEGAHSGSVLAVDISRDSSKIVSGGKDGLVVLWDIQSERPLRTIRHTAAVTVAKFIPEEDVFIFGGADGKLAVYNYREDKQLPGLSLHTADITALALSADGKTAASADAAKNIFLWDTKTARLLNTLPKAKKWVRALHFNRSGETLYAAGDDTRVTYYHIGDSLADFHRLQKGRGWVLSLDQMNNISGEEIIVLSRISGLVQVVTPSGGYKYKAPRPVHKVLFMPQQKVFIGLVVATRGKGILIVEGKDMKVTN